MTNYKEYHENAQRTLKEHNERIRTAMRQATRPIDYDELVDDGDDDYDEDNED